MYALVDCDNFYVSCERVFAPHLKDRPVLVLSSNDGCIIARSNEAKALGFPMGAPIYQHREMLEKHRVFRLSSNFALYGDMSMRVMRSLEAFSQNLDVYSIDEAFLTLPQGLGSLENFAQSIVQTIASHLGLPVSVGIAKSKTLAKLAVLQAKTDPQKVCVIDSAEHRDYLLSQTAPVEIWGIGRRMAKTLERFQIDDAYRLTQCDDDWLRKCIAIGGLKTVWELRGISCADSQELNRSAKSIVCSRSFGRKTKNFEDLEQALAVFLSRAAEKLRKNEQMASHISLWLSAGYGAEKHSCSQSQSLLEPSFCTTELMGYARDLLAKLYQKHTVYKKLGVMLSGLFKQEDLQRGLFDQRDLNKQKALMQVLDQSNRRYKRNTLRLASSLGSDACYAQSHKKSPAYTTSWDELLTVRI